MANGTLAILLTTSTTNATTFHINDDLIGKPIEYVVQEEDTLYEIARKHDLGIVEVLAANPGIDPWVPAPGTTLILPTQHIVPPTPRKGIVINLPELRLYYHPEPDIVMTFPIGLGREGWETPVTKTKIVRKRKDPTWVPPPSIRAENPELPESFPPGPDNPLGKYALDLGLSTYRIHGTNKPFGIGWRSSHGCIRMYPEDIEELFPQVSVGTPVTIIDDPYKLGWQGNELWMELTPPQQQTDIIADYQKPQPIDIPNLHRDIEEVAGNADIDWYAVDNALQQPNGIPIMIARTRSH